MVFRKHKHLLQTCLITMKSYRWQRTAAHNSHNHKDSLSPQNLKDTLKPFAITHFWQITQRRWVNITLSDTSHTCCLRQWIYVCAHRTIPAPMCWEGFAGCMAPWQTFCWTLLCEWIRPVCVKNWLREEQRSANWTWSNDQFLRSACLILSIRPTRKDGDTVSTTITLQEHQCKSSQPPVSITQFLWCGSCLCNEKWHFMILKITQGAHSPRFETLRPGFNPQNLHFKKGAIFGGILVIVVLAPKDRSLELTGQSV